MRRADNVRGKGRYLIGIGSDLVDVVEEGLFGLGVCLRLEEVELVRGQTEERAVEREETVAGRGVVVYTALGGRREVGGGHGADVGCR